MANFNESFKIKHEAIPHEEISDSAVLSKTPLVSIKMITYNHEPYIAKAIEGVVSQETNFPFELIIGEDCSTDRTREIVLNYQRMYPDIIRVVISDKNVGMKENGRRTWISCRGKYIAWCEGDDYWHEPRKLQVQIDFLEANPDYGVVHSDLIHYDVSRKKVLLTRKQLALNDRDAYEEILTGKRVLCTATVCTRHTILKKAIDSYFAERDNKNWPMGDTPTWLELAKLTKIKYIDKKLVTKNKLPESASNSQSTLKLLDFWQGGNDMRFYYLNKYPLSEEQTKKIISKRLGYTMYLAYAVKRWDLVKYSFKQMRNRGCPLRPINYFYYYSSLNFLIYILLYPVIMTFKLANKFFDFLGIRVRLKY